MTTNIIEVGAIVTIASKYQHHYGDESAEWIVEVLEPWRAGFGRLPQAMVQTLIRETDPRAQGRIARIRNVKTGDWVYTPEAWLVPKSGTGATIADVDPKALELAIQLRDRERQAGELALREFRLEVSRALGEEDALPEADIVMRVRQLHLHKVTKRESIANDEEARRICDAITHDLALPSATTTEIVLARYLKRVLDGEAFEQSHEIDRLQMEIDRLRENRRAFDIARAASAAPRTCPQCEWSTSVMNYGTPEAAIWLCHGCAARRIQG